MTIFKELLPSNSRQISMVNESISQTQSFGNLPWIVGARNRHSQIICVASVEGNGKWGWITTHRYHLHVSQEKHREGKAFRYFAAHSCCGKWLCPQNMGICKAKLEILSSFAKGEPSRGIALKRVQSSWMLWAKWWLGQGDSCSRNQGSHIKEWQTCFSHWLDNDPYGRNWEIIWLSLSRLSLTLLSYAMCLGSSKEQFHPISLGYVGAVSSHIINLFLLLLDHQIIIFQLLLGHLIIICWLCMLYLRAFQGKGFLTVKTKDP